MKNPIDLDFNGDYWLGVQVTGDAEELSPRYRLVSVPYAFRATYADSAGSMQPSAHDHGGETWTGDGTGTGLTLQNYSTGLRATGMDTAIIAYSPTGPAIVAISGELPGGQGPGGSGPELARALTQGGRGGVVGPGSSDNSGIWGGSNSGVGVEGFSNSGVGVKGLSADGTGVYGYTVSGNGVTGYSTSGIGVHGESIHGKAGLFEGDVEVTKEVYAKSFHTVNDAGATTSGVTPNGDASYTSLTTQYGASFPRSGDGFVEIGPFGTYYMNDELIGSWNSYNGDFYTQGDLSVDGTKNAVAPTSSCGKRKLYVDESAEVYFFDRGQGQLVNGEVTIELDPMFLETVTVDDDHPMLVQITLTADCNGVFIAEKTASSFTVKELMGGTSNATFDWEVAAKRKGYEDVRLEPFTMEAEREE